MNLVIEKLDKILKNTVFQMLAALIFLTPLIETIGQFDSSKFMYKSVSIKASFLPGSLKNLSFDISAEVVIILLFSLYAVGILYMLIKRAFGKAAIVGILGYLCSQILFYSFSSTTGFKDMQTIESMVKSNDINQVMFYLWEEPFIEEVLFRGLPLLIIMFLKNKVPKKAFIVLVILYFIVPSALSGVSALPHGVSRIPDTVFMSVIFAYIAYQYSFFSSLVVHIGISTASIINMVNMKEVQQSQIPWLVQNSWFVTTSIKGLFIVLIISIPAILLWNMEGLK